MQLPDDLKIEDSAFFSCLWEATARKLGNVHPNTQFTGLEYLDFVYSAKAIAPVLARAPRNTRVGVTVREAIVATRRVIASNTNLGIVLLLAPLASAFIRFHDASPSCQNQVQKKLLYLSIQDTKDVYAAIRLASPGGLGDSPEQDVRDEPTVTLLEAMKLAADRDMIARQYANGFADVFDFGVPVFLDGFQKFGCIEAAIIDCQLRWLAEFPDSLIARKKGLPVAEDVQRRVKEVLALGGLETPEGRAAGVALDKHLRSDGNKLNPGTTADLITACLFVALRENKVTPSAPFRWNVEDWL